MRVVLLGFVKVGDGALQFGWRYAGCPDVFKVKQVDRALSADAVHVADLGNLLGRDAADLDADLIADAQRQFTALSMHSRYKCQECIDGGQEAEQ